MPAPTLEERVTELEQKMSQVLSKVNSENGSKPWWKMWHGAFKDDPDSDAEWSRDDYQLRRVNARLVGGDCRRSVDRCLPESLDSEASRRYDGSQDRGYCSGE